MSSNNERRASSIVSKDKSGGERICLVLIIATRCRLSVCEKDGKSFYSKGRVSYRVETCFRAQHASSFSAISESSADGRRMSRAFMICLWQVGRLSWAGVMPYEVLRSLGSALLGVLYVSYGTGNVIFVRFRPDHSLLGCSCARDVFLPSR